MGSESLGAAWVFEPEPEQLLRAAAGLAFRRGNMEAVYNVLRGKDLDTGEISEHRRAEPEPEEREDSEAQKAVNKLVDALLASLPESIEQMSSEGRGRWLLAQLLNWHRREDRSFWTPQPAKFTT